MRSSLPWWVSDGIIFTLGRRRSSLAGSGVKPGYVHVGSDTEAIYPTEKPVRPGDLAATVFYLLGIDPESEIRDRGRGPLAIGSEVLHDVIA